MDSGAPRRRVMAAILTELAHTGVVAQTRVAHRSWPHRVQILSESYRLRDAATADMPALLALETMFPGDRLSARQMRHHVSSPRARVRVVERDGAVVGYALLLLRRGSRIARLYSVAVDPAMRGAGLGAALLKDALQQAHEAACDRLRLEVREDNLPAISVYRRAGFAEIGRLPAYYDDGCAALRLERAVGRQ